MNKDEILERSRMEGQDEYEDFVLARAKQISMAVGGVLCMVFVVLETIFTGEVNFSTWSVYLAMEGITNIVNYTHLKRKSGIMVGVFDLLLSAAMMALHIYKIVIE